MENGASPLYIFLASVCDGKKTAAESCKEFDLLREEVVRLVKKDSLVDVLNLIIGNELHYAVDERSPLGVKVGERGKGNRILAQELHPERLGSNHVFGCEVIAGGAGRDKFT